MRKNWKLKTLLASILVTMALVLPYALVAEGDPLMPALQVEGVQMNVMTGGDVQMLFTIYVNNVKYSDGARFQLQYNPKYLTPSVQSDNKPIVTVGTENRDDFFQFSTQLYTKKEDGKPINPFRKIMNNKNYYSQVDTTDTISTISMQLWMLNNLESGYGLTKLNLDESVDGTYFVFDSSENKVALGTLSFRVNPEVLPQLAKDFSGVVNTSDPMVNGDYLVKLLPLADPGSGGKQTWSVGACIGEGAMQRHVEINDTTPAAVGKAQPLFTFDFPKTMISAVAAEADVTLNAYQAYTDGKVTDPAQAMQKYSPMVTATYADGSKENFLFQWAGSTMTGDAYAATGGSYTLTQAFWYQKGSEKVKFPVPITGNLTVTPITLVDVTADNLSQTYILRNSLLDQVQTAGDLSLPSEARLRTDVVPGAVSLTMPIPGWTPTKTGSVWPAPGAELGTLLADESPDPADPADRIHWPTSEDSDKWDTVTDKRKGVYTFAMAESYGGAFSVFQKTDIQAAYKWLTIPGETYALDNASRRLIGNDNFLDTERYEVEYISTATDLYGHPKLTLQVSRNSGGLLEPMGDGAQFRVLLPDGTELGTGLTSSGTVGGTVTVPDWFADKLTNHGSYDTAPVPVGDHNVQGYQLTAVPGDSMGAAAGASADQRELLRRHINLGGWFYVSINENPDQYAWTDAIPVFVTPRANAHTDNREYNFIGPNAALYGWPGGLNTTVTLPQGSYQPVDAAGDPIYVDSMGNDTPVAQGNTRKTERYGAPTTYDGLTGAEPGRLNTFTVDGNQPAWGPVTSGPAGDSINTYGADTFKDAVRYGAYGTVRNPDGMTATLRKQGALPAAQTEKITLTYGGTTGVSYDSLGNVDLATYDTRTQGYTTRQDYTLIITNVGAADIYDLNIDGLTDVDSDGGHFVLLKPPAAFLPAGASTTFTLTYVYGLTASGNASVDYRDTLFITSSGHPTSGVSGDYLLDFDAKFNVSAEDIHKVIVKVIPGDGSMGTAGVVMGEKHTAGGEPPYTIDVMPGTTTFHTGAEVTVAVTPTDEYSIKTIVAKDGSGANVPLAKYGGGDGSAQGSAKIPDGVMVYTFIMPDYDATVTVTLYEDLYSKLRLSDLKVFAAPAETGLKPVEPNPAEYTLWQKSYTEKEERAALAHAGNDKNDPRYREYLMTSGTAAKTGFFSSADQYLVVLPYEAHFAQIEATLRKVVLLSDDNKGIAARVSMWHYPKNPVTETVVTDGILPPEDGYTNEPIPPDATKPDGPTTHTSKSFPAPNPRGSNYVRVDIVGQEGGTSTVTRSYYIELHWAPKDPIATLHYGNAPYGMIMSAGNIDGTVKDADGLTAKDRAKKAFVASNHTFAGLAVGAVPAKAAAGKLESRYHTEAWVPVTDLYEPESGTGLNHYQAANNLDLSETAFFATLGQPFEEPGIKEALDSSGRKVDLSKATLSVDVITLNSDPLAPTPPLTQAQRFAGPDPADPDMIAARTVTLTWDKITYDLTKPVIVAADWNKTKPDGSVIGAVRPGLYVLKYHYLDYDGTTPMVYTRPLVLLAPIGDANADETVNPADVTALQGRVADPLGYTAPDYPAAAIFRYRSCDVNNDRNINNIDANRLRDTVTTRFYLPTNYR